MCVQLHTLTSRCHKIAAEIGQLLRSFITTLFGAGSFDSILGDVCTLPMFRVLLEQVATSVAMPENDKQSKFDSQRMEQLNEEEVSYCKQLGENLLQRIDARAREEVDFESAFDIALPPSSGTCNLLRETCVVIFLVPRSHMQPLPEKCLVFR